MKKFLLCSLLFLLMQILIIPNVLAKQANYEADKDALLNSGLHMGENQLDIYWFEKGEKLFEIAEFEKAIDAYTKALAINENYTDAYFKRAEANLELKNYELAKEDYSHTLETRSTYLEAYFKRAVCSYYLKEYQNAIDDSSVVITLNPEHGGSYLIKAVCQQRLNQPNDAIITYQTLLKQVPKNQKQIIQTAKDMLKRLGIEPEK